MKAISEMEFFTLVKVRLLRDDHPVGYRKDWLNKGDTAWVQVVPRFNSGQIYLGTAGDDGKGLFTLKIPDAVEGVDFERMDR